MVMIKHKLRDFHNQKDIAILILGTFNPDTPKNEAEFFYGRGKNYLWNLLPNVFGLPGLKVADSNEKISFITKQRIGFADIIQQVEVENGKETYYSDEYIDNKVSEWIDFELFLNTYQGVRKVFFTRKTFSGIPNIKKEIDLIKKICSAGKVVFSELPTPARFQNQKKLDEWKEIFNL